MTGREDTGWLAGELLATDKRAQACVLIELGRRAEAVALYDEALAPLNSLGTPAARAESIDILVDKAAAVANLDRLDDAIAIHDNVLATYLAAQDEPAVRAQTPRVVQALLYKLQFLCELDRFADAELVKDQLTATLGDVRYTPPRHREAPSYDEHELARLVSEVFDRGVYWSWFDPGGDAPPRHVAAEHAIELYRRTEPSFSADPLNWDDRAHAAAAWLRDIADGCAMLSQPLTAGESRVLPLPDCDRRPQPLQRLGITTWVTDHGVKISAALADESIKRPDAFTPLLQQDDDAVDAMSDFCDRLLTALYSYELLTLLCDSPTGRQCLGADNLKRYATRQVIAARKWVRWLASRSDEAATLAVAWQLIAEAFWVAAFDGYAASDAICPPRAVLRGLLRDDDLQRWLSQQAVELPGWLRQT